MRGHSDEIYLPVTGNLNNPLGGITHLDANVDAETALLQGMGDLV